MGPRYVKMNAEKNSWTPKWLYFISQRSSFMVFMFDLDTCLSNQFNNRRKILTLERWKENEVEENLELTKECLQGKYVKFEKGVHFILVWSRVLLPMKTRLRGKLISVTQKKSSIQFSYQSYIKSLCYKRNDCCCTCGCTDKVHSCFVLWMFNGLVEGMLPGDTFFF